MKLLIVSICKNEAATIEDLLVRMPKKIKGVSSISFLVVDDGSTDKTAQLARKSGAKTLSDGVSKGLAFRFREVVNYALENDYDAMVNIDGDLQFSPEDIPNIVEPVVSNRADFVAADRFTDPDTGEMRKPLNMPAVKYYGNKLGAKVVSRLSDTVFRDVTCGFRAYNKNALIALNINGKHTYTQESFQVLAAKMMRIVTIPTEVKYFKDRKSRVVTSVPRFIIKSAVNILRSYRDFAPLRFFFALGVLPFVVGISCLVFILVHWIATGDFSPYKFVGFAGLYLISVGMFFWALALLADMLVRVLNNQEKIYEELRRHKLKK